MHTTQPLQILTFVRGGENFKHKNCEISKNTTLKICLRQIYRKKNQILVKKVALK